MNNQILSKLVFIFSSTIIGFSLISVVFPALVIRITSATSTSFIDPLELGLLAIPLIVVNCIFFLLFFLHSKKLLPKIFDLGIHFLENFDLSYKTSMIILLIIITIYVGFTVEELTQPEFLSDEVNVLKSLENYQIHESMRQTLNQLHTKNFFLMLSESIFDNLRVFPLIASISLLFLTYLFVNQLTSKKFTGLIAVSIILQSFLFREFDSVITYSNFWVLFYLLSLFLLNKSWKLSPISFIISFFAKPLTFAFMPLTLFFITRTNLPKREKIFALSSYIAIPIGLMIFLMALQLDPFGLFRLTDIVVNPPRFFSGFTILPYQLRYDYLVLMLLFPVCFLLYRKSLQGQLHAQSMMVLMAGILLIGALMVGILNYQLNPYRLQPLIVFFAIGFSLLFSKHSIRKN